MKSFTFIVTDPVGLHARPVAKLVQEANQFCSDITMHYNGQVGNMKSIFGVLGLAVPSNATVEIQINGSDEAYAYSHLSSFVLAI